MAAILHCCLNIQSGVKENLSVIMSSCIIHRFYIYTSTLIILAYTHWVVGSDRSVCVVWRTCVANGSARARLSVSQCVCHGQSQAGQHKWGPFISPGRHMARRCPQTLHQHWCNLLAHPVILHTGGKQDSSMRPWQWAWSVPFFTHLHHLTIILGSLLSTD